MHSEYNQQQNRVLTLQVHSDLSKSFGVIILGKNSTLINYTTLHLHEFYALTLLQFWARA
jgi:hypothetical protein